MANGLEAFKKWLDLNSVKFLQEQYGDEEIATLAIACGFDRQAVAQWQTSKRFKGAA